MSSAAHVETDVEFPHRPPSQPVLIPPDGLLETSMIISFIINYLIIISCYSLHDLEIRRLAIPIVRYSSQIPLRSFWLRLSACVRSSAEDIQPFPCLHLDTCLP
jgi:hypothetical protein